MNRATPRRGPFRPVEVVRALVALGLAFGLWFFVADQQSAEILAPAALELRNVPPGLEIVDQSVQRVDVRLRGASGLLRDAPLQGLRAQLDLTDGTPGERTWFLGAEAVKAPSGVQVMRVDPPRVVLRLDRTLTNTVRVSPRVLGEPAAGFEIHRIVIAPAALAVEGPESLLRDLEQITTEPISAQGLREPYSQRVQIELDPSLRPAVRYVELRLQIGEERELRELRLAVRQADEDPAEPPCRVLIGEIGASLRVPSAFAAELDAEAVGESSGETPATALFAEVSCDGLADGTHEVVPTLAFPEAGDPAVAVVSFDPPTVPVSVGPPPEPADPGAEAVTAPGSSAGRRASGSGS